MITDSLRHRLGAAHQRTMRAVSHSPLYGSSRPVNAVWHDDPDFLWFRVAKAGATTVKRQLRANGLEIEEQFSVRYPVKRLEHHFAFAFVRNPWDRLVSCWASKVRGRKNMFRFDPPTHALMQDFARFTDFVAGFDLVAGDPHLRLQTRLVDFSRVDFVGRYEQFGDDADAVFVRLGLRFDRSYNPNPSDRQLDFRTYYTDDLAERVGNLYERDVRLLGYRFDP